MEAGTFDPVWEARYRDNPGYRNHYPWSSVVSFVYNSKPRNRGHESIRILEVGCGNGANLFFAAREGFSVSGIDGSHTAIAYAKAWFAREGLVGDLRVGDFTSLPFEDNSFDLVIDRSALSFAPVPGIRKAIEEVWRVLRPGGKFLFTPYSDRCTSFDGLPDEDGCYRNVHVGSIVPGAQTTFVSIREVRSLLDKPWVIRRIVHHEETEFHRPERMTHAEWQVEAQKPESTGD